MPVVNHHFVLREGFPADSAFLDGHFPGNPIVPGAAILGFLSARLAAVDQAIARVCRMKFSRILRPETRLEITLVSKGASVRAEFRDEKGIVASADLVLRAS